MNDAINKSQASGNMLVGAVSPAEKAGEPEVLLIVGDFRAKYRSSEANLVCIYRRIPEVLRRSAAAGAETAKPKKKVLIN